MSAQANYAAMSTTFPVLLQVLLTVSLFQVVGSRGPTQINPRNLMLSESAVIGVALATATPVSLSCEDESGWVSLSPLYFVVHSPVIKIFICLPNFCTHPSGIFSYVFVAFLSSGHMLRLGQVSASLNHLTQLQLICFAFPLIYCISVNKIF